MNYLKVGSLYNESDNEIDKVCNFGPEIEASTKKTIFVYHPR